MRSDAAVVVFHHFLQCGEPAIVHVRCRSCDVPQAGDLELPLVLRVTGHFGKADVRQRWCIESVVEGGRREEVGRHVALIAPRGAVEEQVLPFQFLRGEGGEPVRFALIIACGGTAQGAHELGQRAGDPIGRYAVVPEGGGEQGRIVVQHPQPLDHLIERHAHFDRVLDRHEHLLFQGARPFVPELAAHVPVVDQMRRVPPGDPTAEPSAVRTRVGEAMFLLMARCTARTEIGAEVPVVEQHPTQSGSRIRDRVPLGRAFERVQRGRIEPRR